MTDGDYLFFQEGRAMSWDLLVVVALVGALFIGGAIRDHMKRPPESKEEP